MAVPIFTYNNGRGEGGDTGRYVGQSIQVGFYLFSWCDSNRKYKDENLTFPVF